MSSSGSVILADSLRAQGIQYMFGIVGIPIVEVAYSAQAAGIKYIGMRNEQSASYAASIIGYLTNRPGVCLVVPGPGLIHALAGIVNAFVNCWPMVVIAGSFDQDQVGMGGFQEWNQISSVQSSCKFSARIETLESIPYLIEKVVRTSLYGRPGPTYIEIPGNLVNELMPGDNISYPPCCPDPPLTLSDPLDVKNAVKCLMEAKRPLVIIGKGAAYSRAEHELRLLLVRANLPFLPTPMGKGVLPDDHPLCVAAARSRALKEADVILLVGARLNWILHFGKPPRFNENVKIIQVDISPEEMSNNVPAHVMLCGNAKSVIKQLSDALCDIGFKGVDPLGNWWSTLRNKIDYNTKLSQSLASQESVPMNFYCAYKQITDYIPRDAIVVNEGANTMDIGRTVVKTHFPRHRLDAGTFGTMGVGTGFAIAAALYTTSLNKSKKQTPVYCIQGDSAFGFSGMEIETAYRYKLPIVFIIMNNSGIYQGLPREQYDDIMKNEDPFIK
ncbi:PREDICTED: 2-hydroxyacyl-CoA lyase 1-like [Amphimedon queenslandica]|uniref:2-hydroxyacyl-CoA lyase n=1 Tax=Amphimedon queenslandica TaxID=400682 RepID=A0AAN0J9C0_AMPQE|nr:PREDICTED: 2-hydroxyacyl-CoA lyase 1-like [Amphimedon queenslandica]|eukprot:XP_019853619.1 PREDICTED: 2-hydroxyacyl-CoA lyase 1-like [Amphimedon queenslandica]